MTFVSSKQDKQKERGITIKVYIQGMKESKALTVHGICILDAYKKIVELFNNNKISEVNNNGSKQ